jgi:diguanylate cyclase (GGDEF)-like protein/PAS domain S-box-containing protein
MTPVESTYGTYANRYSILRLQVEGIPYMSFATELFARTLQDSSTASIVLGCGRMAGQSAIVNVAFEHLTGFTSAELAASGLAILHGSGTSTESISHLQAAVTSGTELRLVILSYRRDGGSFWNDLHIMPLRAYDGTPTHLMGMMTDVSADRLLAQQLEHRAHHDALTGLPNRHLFRDRIDQQIVQAQRDGRPFALMLIDVNHFKRINDALGHDIGDQLLRTLGARLRRCARASDTVARYGGDEFVLLLGADSNGSRLEGIRSRIDRVMQRPVVIDGYEIRISCSVGVSVYPVDGLDQSALFRKADMAMYSDKSTRRVASTFHISATRDAAAMLSAAAGSLRANGTSSLPS